MLRYISDPTQTTLDCDDLTPGPGLASVYTCVRVCVFAPSVCVCVCTTCVCFCTTCVCVFVPHVYVCLHQVCMFALFVSSTYSPLFSFFAATEYMNQSHGGSSLSSRLSEVLNPNYEDLGLGWGASALPATLEDASSLSEAIDDPKRLTCLFEAPEYLNIAQTQSCLLRYTNDSLDNPDYQADFLPPNTTNTSGLFLPVVENLEYLALDTAVQPPVR